MTSHDPAPQPVFYFDLASPEAYLTAERVLHDLPEVAEWQPVWLGGLRAGELGGFRCAQEIASLQEDIERAARIRGLQPVRWPERRTRSVRCSGLPTAASSASPPA